MPSRIRIWLYYVAQWVSARVTVIEGIPRGGTTPVRCLLIGEDSWLHIYIKSLFLAPGESLQTGVRESAWKIWRRLKYGRDTFDVCFIVPPLVLESWVSRNAQETVCQSVSQRVDTTDWEKTRRRMKKRRRTLANRYERDGTRFSIMQSRRDSDLVLFYEKMYVPFTRKRHGSMAHLPSLADFRHFFQSGSVLFAMRNSVPVAGTLLVSHGRILQDRWIGILHGDESLISDGVQAILYYYTLKHAALCGYEALDMTESAPFLVDGVYKHKSEWGACPFPSREFGAEEYLLVGSDNRSVAAFFHDFPLIVRYGDGLAVMAGIPDGSDSDAAWLGEFTRSHALQGLCAVVPHHTVLGRRLLIAL